jgi:hypothetical protein
MNILVSGCSFTQWPDYPGGPNVCWPRYLHELHPNWNIKSVAEAAAGNQYICYSIIQEILDNHNKYDQVLVMWSGVSRLDFLTSLEDKNWEKLFDSYGFFRRMPHGKLGWIFSGGQMGTWFKNPVAHKMFYEMYKVSSELSLALINLQEIVKLQHFLESKNIPYKFMSYVNYWNNSDQLSPNGDFGVLKFPELDYLIEEINFNNWVFCDNNKNGIYELAKKFGSFMDDEFHPGDQAHQVWAKLISEQFV